MGKEKKKHVLELGEILGLEMHYVSCASTWVWSFRGLDRGSHSRCQPSRLKCWLNLTSPSQRPGGFQGHLAGFQGVNSFTS